MAQAAIGHRGHPAVAVVTDVLLALVVLVPGLWSMRGAAGGSHDSAAVVVVLGAALAAGIARRWTAAALALVWGVALVQVYAAGPVFAATLGVAIVAFRSARYGSRVTVWTAGLSIPVGAVVALFLAYARPESVREVAALADSFAGYGVGAVGGFLVIAAVLGAPFVAGLLLRTNEHYRRSRIARELAESQAAAEREIAQSRAAQTMLTRDVHDVVGHSLAVIIAQADSARAGAETADESVRTALAQIAAVGRSSLAEVRDVLSRTRETPPVAAAGGDELAELVAGVRVAGNAVAETVGGEPQLLAADTATAAYRVLQELLTNALKHGIAGRPIAVVRTWTPDGLTLGVDNAVADTRPPVEGMGLAGVRGRVDSVGGTFRTAVTGAQTDDARFAATVFLPATR